MSTNEKSEPANYLSGASTAEAQRIALLSKQIVSDIVADDSAEGMVKQRVVMATGNSAFSAIIRFCNDPIRAGITAIQEGRFVYTDINMVCVGISKDMEHFGGKVQCELPDKMSTVSSEQTRASAGFLKLGENLNNAIVVVGNAPSAAMTVAAMVGDGVRPSLIVATPVGFVNAAESKRVIRALDIPSITTVGTQGGTPVAVAIVNELIAIACS
ncbi:MAG: precorrin-8X methylmutase [Halobacteriota archaeon]